MENEDDKSSVLDPDIKDVKKEESALTKENPPITYIGSEFLGNFVQYGCDIQPLVGDEAKLFKRYLDFDAIEKINSGVPLSCDRIYREYSADYPEKANIFHSVDVLENYLNGTGFESERVVVSRFPTICTLVYPLLSGYSTKPRNVTYRINEKGWVLLEDEDPDHYFEDWEKQNTAAICTELLVKDNKFTENNPILYESRMFRMTKHRFKQFELVCANETDAFWDEMSDESVLIKTRNKGYSLHDSSVIFEAHLMGGIQKLVVPVVEKNIIEKITFTDDVGILPNVDKERIIYQRVIAKFFNWFYRFLEETRSEEGEFCVSGGGIVAHSQEHYAIYDTTCSQKLCVYQHNVFPRIFISEKVLKAPVLNSDVCVNVLSVHLNPEYLFPSINYAYWDEELQGVSASAFCFSQRRKPVTKDGRRCRVVESSVFIHFLKSINPDIVVPRIPTKPVLAISPIGLNLPVEKGEYEVAVDEPWTCNVTGKNVIVTEGTLRNLHRIISYHEWQGDITPVNLTVLLFLNSNVPDAVIQRTLRRAFCEQTISNARIELCTKRSEVEKLFKEVLGEPPKTLYLVDGKSSVTGNWSYDIQEIDDFLNNGFSESRRQPTKILVVGSEEQYEKVSEVIRNQGIPIRVMRGV